MTTPLDLATHTRADGALVLKATGEIDMSNASAFRAALGEGVGSAGRLVVDLTGIEYLDSAGLAALFAHAAHLHVMAPPLLNRVLTVSGLTDMTTIVIV